MAENIMIIITRHAQFGVLEYTKSFIKMFSNLKPYTDLCEYIK